MVNYLGHFLLTNQLLDVLKQGQPARILTVAGNPSFLKNPQINLENIELTKNYSGLRATSQAMFARTVFSFELAKQLAGSGVSSVAPPRDFSLAPKKLTGWLKFPALGVMG